MLKNTKQKTNHSHCKRSEAISSGLPRATALAMTNETGRSMVEMLGVLAIIGVLSITGISGYTTAMNKHRANEILDAASKRAVVVSTQLQSGRTNPTLAEFGDDTVQGVAFGTPATVGDNQFKLPLDWTGISDEDQQETLCEYMQQYISEDGEDATAQIDTNCTRIVYNNDLSVGTSSSNNTNYNSSTQKCKTGYYGDDCATACPKAHQIANEDNDGCVCENGYTLNNSTKECEKTDCTSDGYNSGSCPSEATCSTCLSGTDPYYKITSCGGTGKVPNTNADSCVCASNYESDGNGGCQLKLKKGGEACTEDNECTSNYCSGGEVCACNSETENEYCCGERWKGGLCCTSASLSKECCEDVYYYDWLESGVCCSSRSDSKECCENDDGKWVNSTSYCCDGANTPDCAPLYGWHYDAAQSYYCDGDSWDSSEEKCCVSVNSSEWCCTTWSQGYGSGARYEDGTCWASTG